MICFSTNGLGGPGRWSGSNYPNKARLFLAILLAGPGRIPPPGLFHGPDVGWVSDAARYLGNGLSPGGMRGPRSSSRQTLDRPPLTVNLPRRPMQAPGFFVPPVCRLDRLRLRGPRGAQDEFVLASIAQNLRRLAKLVARPPQYALQCIV